MGKIYGNMTELVGNTPLLQLKNIEKKLKLKAHLFGKCECYNPAFSVKDRIAKNMLDKVSKKQITKETVFVEATSGNTGIALAAMCASKGYKLVIIMPENVTKERIMLIRHFGAQVILTPKEDGMQGAVQKAQILKEKNEHVIVLNQFENQANIEAHTLTTATEILTDTKGEIDALVAGVGTAGTLIGTARALKTCIPDLQVIAVEPKSSPVLSQGITGPHKILGIGPNFIPPFYDKELVDEVISVSNEDALNGAEMSAKLEGLAVGISAGAALKAAITVAKRVEMANKNIVVILPDSIERYLSMGYFGI
ncbi:MAG: cysteine synthase A [Alphaproteobacteria bacterium]|nr:cysteine synthase A [Alphaproteobacteria bacterium]MBO7097487.1 cysteine synthase A [Alphaproteobacteria bacterium]